VTRGGEEAECVPPTAPLISGFRFGIEDDEIETTLVQKVPDSEPGLATTDHDHLVMRCVRSGIHDEPFAFRLAFQLVERYAK
jgi:hypothetical protein